MCFMDDHSRIVTIVTTPLHQYGLVSTVTIAPIIQQGLASPALCRVWHSHTKTVSYACICNSLWRILAQL